MLRQVIAHKVKLRKEESLMKGNVNEPSLAPILIVQPYFVSTGHHAQSFLEMARILRNDRQIKFLICLSKPTDAHAKMAEHLQRTTDARVIRCPRGFPRLRTLFVLALSHALVWKERRVTSIVLADVHLPTAALAIFMVPAWCLPRRLYLTYLGGPERICRWLGWQYIIETVFRKSAVRLSVRTEELATAWRLAFPSLPPEKFPVIRHVENFANPKNGSSSLERKPGPARFGIFGEIRRGKSFEWLVPLFAENPTIGELCIAGAFADHDNRKRLSSLLRSCKFSEGFLNYDDMCRRVGEMDYLLLLYDNWDCRMESGALFMAAKQETPVIVFAPGWLGRMCREYGLGIVLASDTSDRAGLLAGVPIRGSKKHKEMIEGLRRFRCDNSSSQFRESFLKECGGFEEKVQK